MENENMNVNSEVVVETVEPKKSNAMAIVGLVLSIISLPIDCCYGIGTIFAIVGLILSIIGMKKNKNGLSITALVVSIVAIIFGVIMIAIYGATLVAMIQSGDFQAIMDEAMYGTYY